MREIFSTKVGWLRFVGLLEVISLLFLIGIAVPAKHFFGDPTLVKAVGPVHGVLFLLFIFNALQVGIEQRWNFATTTWKVLIACIIPFGTFYIDQKILSKVGKEK